MRIRSQSRVVTALRRALREPGLALVIWAAHLLIALAAILPLRAYLVEALAFAPEGDRLLSDFDAPLLFDLIRGAKGSMTALGPLIFVAFALALLWNALAAGGAIEVLRLSDRRPLLLRFGRGAGRYFGRFLRMGAAAVPCALLVAALVSAPLWIARAAFGPGDAAPRFLLRLAGIALGLIGLTIALLALDLARVEVARRESSRAVRIFLATLLDVLRRPLPVLALWLQLAVTLAITIVILFLLRRFLPPGGGLLLVATIVLQQAATFARALYRVALWSGEIALTADGDRRGSRIAS